MSSIVLTGGQGSSYQRKRARQHPRGAIFADFPDGAAGRPSEKESRGFIKVGEIEGLAGGDALVECGLDDPGAGEGDHCPEALLEGELTGGQAEAGGEGAVVGAGRPAALEVAEDDATGLKPGALLDELGDEVADAAEPHVAEGVGLSGVVHGAPLGELGALGDNDDAVILT